MFITFLLLIKCYLMSFSPLTAGSSVPRTVLLELFPMQPSIHISHSFERPFIGCLSSSFCFQNCPSSCKVVILNTLNLSLEVNQ